MTITEIIEKWEIPREYQAAIFEAYKAGGDRVMDLFIEKTVKQFTIEHAIKQFNEVK